MGESSANQWNTINSVITDCRRPFRCVDPLPLANHYHYCNKERTCVYQQTAFTLEATCPKTVAGRPLGAVHKPRGHFARRSGSGHGLRSKFSKFCMGKSLLEVFEMIRIWPTWFMNSPLLPSHISCTRATQRWKSRKSLEIWFSTKCRR